MSIQTNKTTTNKNIKNKQNSNDSITDSIKVYYMYHFWTYHIFWTIVRYFFSLKSWPRPILRMRRIYCFIKFRSLKITCNSIQIRKIMQITLEIYCRSISANITWNRCGLQYECGLSIIFFKKKIKPKNRPCGL
jgi:hypothetical protein